MKKLFYVAIILTSIILTGCSGNTSVKGSSFLMDTVITTTLYNADENNLDEIESLLKDCEKNLLTEVPRDAEETLDSLIISTDGLFDYRIGKLIKLWGIGTDHARVPSQSEIDKVLDDRSTFDPGSYGKGYACDELRKYLEDSNIKGACIAVGGSILCYGEHDGRDYYTVAVRDPRGEISDYIGMLKIKNAVVSTSGDYEHVFEENGIKYHHILSTKMGYPIDAGLTSVTVVSESGLLSDTLSTAAFALGYEKGKVLLEEYNCEGIFVDKDMNIYTTDGIEFERVD